MHKVLNSLKEEAHSTLTKTIKLEKRYRRKEKCLKKEADLRLRETLRKSLVQEIEAAVVEINVKIGEKEEIFNSIPSLYKEEEIWISVRRYLINNKSYYSFYVSERGREYAEELAIRLEKEGKFKGLRVDEYRRRVEMLKLSIIKGRMDEILRMEGEETLFEIFGYNGKLLPNLLKHATD